MLLQKRARYIAILMVFIVLAFSLSVPIGETKRMPPWLFALWVAYTEAKDAYETIKGLIAIIVEDIEEMKEIKAKTEKELRDKLYPRRDKLEEQLKEAENALEKLEKEHEAALEKRRNAKSRIRSLNRQIAQIEATLSMVSPSESDLRDALEAELRQKKLELTQAEQDVKDANKIINSVWRAVKMEYYRLVIGDAFTGLKGKLSTLNTTIGIKEDLVDQLDDDIEKHETDKKSKETRERELSDDVKKKRAAYEKGKKQGKESQR